MEISPDSLFGCFFPTNRSSCRGHNRHFSMPERSLHRASKLAVRALLPIIAIALACKPVPPTPSAPSSPAAFLPPIAAIPQAVDAGEIEEFDRENLWINLNGAATYYLDYGCVRMVTRA